MVLHDLMLYLFIIFLHFLQYISLLFIGMLVVISVRGFLTNLMKVFLLLSIATFFLYTYFFLFISWIVAKEVMLLLAFSIFFVE